MKNRIRLDIDIPKGHFQKYINDNAFYHAIGAIAGVQNVPTSDRALDAAYREHLRQKFWGVLKDEMDAAREV